MFLLSFVFGESILLRGYHVFAVGCKILVCCGCGVNGGGDTECVCAHGLILVDHERPAILPCGILAGRLVIASDVLTVD